MGAQGADLAARIQRLEDIEAIKQLMARYAMACDETYNLEKLMALFTQDIVFDFGEQVGVYRGAEAAREFWRKAPEINVRPLHYMISPIVEVAADGQTARGSWYLWEETTQPDVQTGELVAVWAAGVYDNEFVKENGQWKIKKIKLNFELLSPYTDGWAKTRFREIKV